MQTPDHQRVLAVVSFDEAGLTVARSARRIALEHQADLALGQIAHWDWGTSAEHGPGIVTADAMASLRPVLIKRLRETARVIGSASATPLVALAASQKRGIDQLVASWLPDILVVNASSALGLRDGERLRVNLPFVTAAPMIRLVQATEPAGRPGPRLGPLWGWLRQ